MRKNKEVYWTTSLPREHEALQGLDAYCREWGGLSRAEATRRLLIEWDKIRRGQPTTAWVPNIPAHPMELDVSERAPRSAGTVKSSSSSTSSARSASQMLDD